MITEKNMKVFDIKHDNKTFRILVDNIELAIYTEEGRFVAKNPSCYSSYFACASMSSILNCLSKKNVFNFEKTKERTAYKVESIMTGMNMDSNLIHELVSMIRCNRFCSPDGFTQTCTLDFLALCPELITQNPISICMDYPEAAIEAVNVFIKYVQPILAQKMTDKYEESIVVVDHYNKNGPELYPSNYKGINDRIQIMYEFYGMLYKSGVLKELAFEYKEYEDVVYFAFEINKIIPFVKSNNNPIIDAATNVFLGTMSPCRYCGAIQPGALMATYRDVCGCVSRSHECEIVQWLDTVACGMIYDEKKRCGVKDAVSLAFSLACFKQ